MKNKDNFWDLFDDIICINLITEEESYQHALEQFKKHNIKN